MKFIVMKRVKTRFPQSLLFLNTIYRYFRMLIFTLLNYRLVFNYISQRLLFRNNDSKDCENIVKINHLPYPFFKVKCLNISLSFQRKKTEEKKRWRHKMKFWNFWVQVYESQLSQLWITQTRSYWQFYGF